MPAADDTKRKAARETIDILHEISILLVCARPFENLCAALTDASTIEHTA